jgi:hypothetical protein
LKLSKRNIRAAADEKLNRTHTKMVGELVEHYHLYERSRGECLRLAVEINNTGVWRKTHITFANFLMDTLEIQKSQAYRLIEAAKIVESKEESGESPPTTERSARAISDAKKNGEHESKNDEESEQPSVRNSTEQNSPSGGMRNSVKSGSKPPKPEMKFDRIGTPITDDALPWWEGEHIKNLNAELKVITDLKKRILDYRSDGNFMWMKITNTIESDIAYLYFLIKEAKPYAICTTCQGSPSLQPEGCSYCHNTGLISKRFWDTASMKEIKEIRMKSNRDIAKKHPNSPLNKDLEPEDD